MHTHNKRPSHPVIENPRLYMASHGDMAAVYRACTRWERARGLVGITRRDQIAAACRRPRS